MPPKRKKNRTLPILREVIAVLAWSYVLVKLFVYDVDVYVVERLCPAIGWVIRYKFVVLVVLLAVVWTATRKRTVLLWGLYIAFYPFIVLFYRVPLFIFRRRSWVLAIAVLDSAMSFFRTTRVNLVLLALLLSSGVIVLVTAHRWLLWPTTASLAVVLLFAYGLIIVRVFKTPAVYRTFTAILTKIRGDRSAFAVDESLRGLPVASYDTSQMAKWSGTLQTSVLYNRLCLFGARKLSDFRKSGFIYFSSVATLLLLLILTVIVFALINLGCYKIDHASFAALHPPAQFTFFYYSFNRLVFNSIPELSPAIPFTQAVSMAESFLALLLGLVFGSLLLSERKQKRMEELDDTIRRLEAEGSEMELFIRDEYQLSCVEDAMAELVKMKASFATFLYKISESIP
ncbi:MAG TPA: hypothetical protein VMH22_15430 [bacterium]|nr:hypothetical protein [bacterium]